MPKKPRQHSREHTRLEESDPGSVPRWSRWGPYVSERAWATVREDYSANGDPWSFLPHDLARSKAYRWALQASAIVTSFLSSRSRFGTGATQS